MFENTNNRNLANGTSFHGMQLEEYSLNDLKKVFGEPLKVNDGKGNYMWVLKSELEGNPIVTVYDWKLGKFEENQQVNWNVGMHTNDEGLFVDLESFVTVQLEDFNAHE